MRGELPSVRVCGAALEGCRSSRNLRLLSDFVKDSFFRGFGVDFFLFFANFIPENKNCLRSVTPGNFLFYYTSFIH